MPKEEQRQTSWHALRSMIGGRLAPTAVGGRQANCAWRENEGDLWRENGSLCRPPEVVEAHRGWEEVQKGDDVAVAPHVPQNLHGSNTKLQGMVCYRHEMQMATAAPPSQQQLDHTWISRSVRRASSGLLKMSPIFLMATCWLVRESIAAHTMP